jgi:hypothetical protein
MSEREDFLARWSRRKRGGADEVEDVPPAAQPSAREQTSADGPLLNEQNPPLEPTEPPFDPTTLPSLESITAETDIRAFLAPGVPADLTRAALRRAWSTDPKIREFIGLADYAWDFNAPDAMPGFGPLEMTDELHREIVGMLSRGQSRERSREDSASELPENIEQTPGEIGLDRTSADCQSKSHEGSGPKDERQSNQAIKSDGNKNVAVQYQAAGRDQPPAPAQRRHGSALPQD